VTGVDTLLVSFGMSYIAFKALIILLMVGFIGWFVIEHFAELTQLLALGILICAVTAIVLIATLLLIF
jgi:hypothetical protein